jgi:phasin family protein
MLQCNIACDIYIALQQIEYPGGGVMYDMFAKYFENTHELPTQVIKTNKLFVNEFEKLMAFQMKVLQSYMDIHLNQLKAVAEVKDTKSLQNFLSDQTEVANTLREKIMDDAKRLADLSTGFKDSLDDLAKDNMTSATAKAA